MFAKNQTPTESTMCNLYVKMKKLIKAPTLPETNPAVDLTVTHSYTLTRANHTRLKLIIKPASDNFSTYFTFHLPFPASLEHIITQVKVKRWSGILCFFSLCVSRSHWWSQARSPWLPPCSLTTSRRHPPSIRSTPVGPATKRDKKEESSASSVKCEGSAGALSVHVVISCEWGCSGLIGGESRGSGVLPAAHTSLLIAIHPLITVI